MANTKHPILIGSSGWNYEGWEGVFYPEGTKPADYLEWYAQQYPIVEVDSTFYRPATLKIVRGWLSKTPSSFRFVPKVTKSITHEKQLRDCKPEIEEFVASVEPLGDRLQFALLQMGYFNRSAFRSMQEFLDVLSTFLDLW